MLNVKKPIVICENLVKIYKVAELEVFALQGLELTVDPGEMLGIVGTSGSGKTTLMNILGGLDRPSAGKVTVDGLDLLKLNEAELNRYQREKVGFVWQQTSRNLIPYLTALENVELPMTMSTKASARHRRKWAEELLNSIGMYPRRHHKLDQLSGGEQQRVAIAVALANRPVILLGDEPTGEVDSVTAQIIMETFRNLNEVYDFTTIIVTHDPRIASQVDRVVAIRDGKTSTETIRQVRELEHAMTGGSSQDKENGKLHLKQEVTYQEYVVLDSAGRLQVPKEWLEELGIGRRARLELANDNVLIHPVEGDTPQASLRSLSIEEQIALLFAEQPAPPPKKKRGLFFRKRR